MKKIKVTDYNAIVKDIKDRLNWILKVRCPQCLKWLTEDAFEIMRQYEYWEDWWCPNCMEENEGEIRGAPVGGSSRGIIPEGPEISSPEFWSLLSDYQMNFLDGYVQGQVYVDWKIGKINMPPSDYVIDLSFAILRIYLSLELYLPIKIKERLKVLKTDDRVSQLLLEIMKPQVRDYINMLRKLGVTIDKRYFGKLIECQNIRNDIIHKGHKATMSEYLTVFKQVGKAIGYLQKV